jgi:hypothetical protein
MSRKIGELAYNPAPRRRSSVVEQPPCKRQVVCSIQTGGTNVGLCNLPALPAREGASLLGRICAFFDLSAKAGWTKLLGNRPRAFKRGAP